MNIKYSRYKLTPKKRLNRLSSMESKEGVFLSANLNGREVYADYFPHIPLGDASVNEFLSGFQSQKTEYQRKVLELLKNDARYRNFPSKTFQNHQLWSGAEEIKSPVVKYKLLHKQDTTYHEALRRGVRVRLDANAMFTKANVSELLNNIPAEWQHLIDYVEDPLSETYWSSFPLPKARDFIEGSPFDLYVYKPNCEEEPDFSNLIYSAYLGTALGNWHSYCELIENGNTSIHQGIIGVGFYEEVTDFYKGDYESGFRPDLMIIENLYTDLGKREWEDLCSM